MSVKEQLLSKICTLCEVLVLCNEYMLQDSYNTLNHIGALQYIIQKETLKVGSPPILNFGILLKSLLGIAAAHNMQQGYITVIRGEPLSMAHIQRLAFNFSKLTLIITFYLSNFKNASQHHSPIYSLTHFKFCLS